MPPKKDGGKGAKGAVGQKTTKIAEDKTFGMKNKKGAKAQKFIQVVQKQVQNTLTSNAAVKNPNAAEQNAAREKQKLEDKKRSDELHALFKPVIAQTVPKGVDPKSVVCVLFKQNLCQKGERCKFSHDLSVERKTAKRNVYEDTREQDSMANWDEEKLKDVVEQKHGDDNIIKKTTTEKVCRYFLEAVEKKTYGWFWQCPNGDAKCMYKHALPPGFILKSEMKKNDNKDDKLSIEMLIEKERASLGKTVTKVTLITFLAWKKRKIVEKKEERIMEETKKKSNFKLGLHNGLSGRDLFTFNPELVGDDDDGADFNFDRNEEEENNGLEVRDVNLTDFTEREADGTGSTAQDDRFSYMDSIYKQEKEVEMAAGARDVLVEEAEDDENAPGTSKKVNGVNDDDLTEKEHEESLKKMIGKTKGKITNGVKDPTTNIEIDESLFNADDLDDMIDELDDLEIED